MNDTDNSVHETKTDGNKKQRLFDKYIMPNYDFIKGLCARYTAFKDDIEENFNDVLLNFFNYIETYDNNRDLKTWIRVVTKRFIYAVNNKRLVRKNSCVLFPDPIGDISTSDTDLLGISFDEENIESAMNDGIVHALKNMPPIHKKAFMMQLSGYSLKEIASTLNRDGELDSNNINTVKTRIFAARKYLCERVDREGNPVHMNKTTKTQ